MRSVSFTTEERRVVLYVPEEGTGGKVLPMIVLVGDSDSAEEVIRLAKERGEADFSLLSVPVDEGDWARDLSPWPAPGVFRGEGDFTGGADEFLQTLTGKIIPDAEECLRQSGREVAWYGIAGYSLAGLFAVYSLYRTDLFRRAASMSGSLWFPDFVEYARTSSYVGRPDRVYFSLGDREPRTRNPVMRQVQTCTEAVVQICRERGLACTFELNPGNHFVDVPQRIAKGICWILQDPAQE